MNAPETSQPRLSPALVTALVFAVLAILALGLGAPQPTTGYDSYRAYTAAESAAASGTWVPAALALLVCLLPLVLAFRFLDPRTYVAGRLRSDGRVAIADACGELQVIDPPREWARRLAPGPVLLRLTRPPDVQVPPPWAMGYRDAPVAPPVPSARSIRAGSRAQVFRRAQRWTRGSLVVLTVICALAWVFFHAVAMVAYLPNC